MKYSQDTINQIKERISLPAVVGRYISLSRHNKAACPFHHEKTPSFSIHPKKKVWKCFGCGKKGDIFTFVQLIENISFMQSVEFLANEAGVNLPKPKRFNIFISKKWDRKKKEIDKLEFCRKLFKEAYMKLVDFFREKYHQLPKKEKWDSWNSKDYLKEQLLERRFDNLDINFRNINTVIDAMVKEIRRNG